MEGMIDRVVIYGSKEGLAIRVAFSFLILIRYDATAMDYCSKDGYGRQDGNVMYQKDCKCHVCYCYDLSDWMGTDTSILEYPP